MGIYTVDHFESKDEALEYYGNGMKVYYEKTKQLFKSFDENQKIESLVDGISNAKKLIIFQEYYIKASNFDWNEEN